MPRPARSPSAALLAGLVVLTGAAAPGAARAQGPARGTIVRAVDGDTLAVRLAAGAEARVRLIGVDAPEVGGSGQAAECGGAQASAVAAEYAGEPAAFPDDPTQDTQDRFGRLLAYADTQAGVDVGREVIAAGWARAYVYDGRPFARLAAYREAEEEARAAGRGVWGACGGNFDLPAPAADGAPAGDAEDRARTAERHVRRFYFLLNERQHRRAWSLLSPGLRGRLGPYARWRADYRRTLSTRVSRVTVRPASGGAVVDTAIRSRDRDACSGRVVASFFRVRWTLARRDGAWIATAVSGRKVGGGRVRRSEAECARPVAAPPPPRPDEGGGGGGGGGDGRDCHPSYRPCIPTDRDYDCAELDDGPYTVTGDDPYRLDADDDGIGCE